MEAELLVDYPAQTGEGPLWNPMDNKLYWVDIPAGLIFRYDPASGVNEQVYQGEPVGGFTIQADGSLLLFGDSGRVRTWRDGQISIVVPEIPAERDSRFNDVIADPVGRVYCGTVVTASHPGRLYLLDTDGSLTLALDDLTVSNGMGFSPDLQTFYHTDTRRLVVNAYDYNIESGAIGNVRPLVQVPEGEGRPDGMTVDLEGNIWSARWDGWSLVRHAADGQVMERVQFPARKVSSATFGGPDYAELYITSAGGTDRAENGEKAGSLFRLRPKVGGRPPFLSRVAI
ncbi:MAG: SMP-30/gluconolactonase/LRE family protein [Chloroflexota bacterium]